MERTALVITWEEHGFPCVVTGARWWLCAVFCLLGAQRAPDMGWEAVTAEKWAAGYRGKATLSLFKGWDISLPAQSCTVEETARGCIGRRSLPLQHDAQGLCLSPPWKMVEDSVADVSNVETKLTNLFFTQFIFLFIQTVKYEEMFKTPQFKVGVSSHGRFFTYR